MYSPAVITSKLAQKDFRDIQGKHTELLQGIEQQKLTVQAYNQQKAVEQQNRQVMANELEKEKMVANTEAAKVAAQQSKDLLQHQQKTQELEIKRASLNPV